MEPVHYFLALVPIFWILTFIFYFVGSGTNKVKAFIINMSLLTALPFMVVLEVVATYHAWEVDDLLKPLFDQLPPDPYCGL